MKVNIDKSSPWENKKKSMKTNFKHILAQLLPKSERYYGFQLTPVGELGDVMLQVVD